MELSRIIKYARGEEEVDLLLKNVRLVNVLSGEIYLTNVAVARTKIVGFGEYRAKEVLDLDGYYLCPGFIDGHVHIESSMLTIPEFAKVVVPHGTTTVIIDPHEIANVLGLDGIRYMLESSKYNPLSVYVMLPSCVPATDMETSGSQLASYDIAPLFSNPWVLGLAEMMNYPGVIFGDGEVLAKIASARGHPIDGHAPGLTGKDLAAYIAAGIGSDHECTTLEEAREKLRLGMYVMIREGSTAKNLRDLLPLVTPTNARRMMFVTDDRHPGDLIREGHIDHIIRLAIDQGVDPILAIQMATLNPAEYFGLKDLGVIAVGRQADMVLFDNFKEFRILKVWRAGTLVAEDGKIIPWERPQRSIPLRSSMNIKWEGVDFKIPAQSSRVKVIEIIPGQIVTRKLITEAKVVDGYVVSDVERDILKIAVIERHTASGNMGKGLVKGFGLKKGAIASSVAHDSHNIVVVGVSDEEMMRAVREIEAMKGGLVAVADEQVLARLPLPIAGLMSEKSAYEVEAELEELTEATKALGCILEEPFMALSFLALPVIPELKLTDKGLVDVTEFRFVSLFE
ncbi:MAG: adenine deaminase [Anaerolineae bacterium]|nr:adenine deaminase [Anaerolineae bacterium]MDW8102523.1 adenine deaminase [Anaerolineae bacterium]